jgi:maleate isomerase
MSEIPYGVERKSRYRIGLIVPSSNVTMETELPEMFRRRCAVAPETFTFHSSRVRMRNVTPGELERMTADSDRCVVELADAGVDVMAYACLVAVMCQGSGCHAPTEDRLAKVAAENGRPAPVVTSAGSLLRGLKALRATRIALIAPYPKPLTERVIQYMNEAGVQIVRSVNLEIEDNLKVGAHDPARLLEIAKGLDVSGVEAVVLSACVQMPSLAVIDTAEAHLSRPVLSASVATAYDILVRLGLDPVVPGAGALLAGRAQPA